MAENRHVVRAKEFLAVAESRDSKREAYKRAAHEVAAAIADGMNQSSVATAVGRSKSFIEKLLTWRRSGFKADTPWLHDGGATDRAARSHTRRVLSEPDSARRVIKDLPDAALEQVSDAALDERLDRRRKTPRQVRPAPVRRGAFAPWMEVSGDLVEACRLLRRATDQTIEADFDSEQQRLLQERAQRVRELLALFEAALEGQTDVDWDAEFRKLEVE